MNQAQEIAGVKNRIKEPKDLPKVLIHRVGEWLTPSEMNFIVGVFLDESAIDYWRDRNIINRDRVAQVICIDALDEGIIEHDGNGLYRIR